MGEGGRISDRTARAVLRSLLFSLLLASHALMSAPDGYAQSRVDPATLPQLALGQAYVWQGHTQRFAVQLAAGDHIRVGANGGPPVLIDPSGNEVNPAYSANFQGDMGMLVYQARYRIAAAGTYILSVGPYFERNRTEPVRVAYTTAAGDPPWKLFHAAAPLPTPAPTMAQPAPVVQSAASPASTTQVIQSATFSPAATGPRFALIIGNSAYGPDIGGLLNPVNDARLMGQVLGRLGFQVEIVADADQKTMKRAIARFGEKLRIAGRGATGLFFYAGHGIQSRGINYLIPLGAMIQAEADLDIEAVAADSVLSQMEEAGTSTNIIILDACRNMPLTRRFRSASRGLARMDAPNGSFIAYSTAPGSVAADGEGVNSPFVTALSGSIARPGIPLEVVFRDVRRNVLEVTQGLQTPWDSSSLISPFYFAGE